MTETVLITGITGRFGGAYNVGSGREVSVRDLFELVRWEAGMEVELSIESSRVQATDIPCLEADASKVSKELGWEAKIPLEWTVRDTLDVLEGSRDTDRAYNTS